VKAYENGGVMSSKAKISEEHLNWRHQYRFVSATENGGARGWHRRFASSRSSSAMMVSREASRLYNGMAWHHRAASTKTPATMARSLRARPDRVAGVSTSNVWLARQIVARINAGAVSRRRRIC